MKQQITRFQKSLSRQFANLFLGIGLIGLALSVGMDFGFNLGATANWIMLGGFAIATIFLFIAGGEPVAVGNEVTETQDANAKIVLSDDVNNAIKLKIEQAVNEMVANHKDMLMGLNRSAEEMAQKMTSVQNTLERANVSAIADQLSNLSTAIDIKATNAALGSLKGNMTNVLAGLDDLAKVTTAGSKKLGSVMHEFDEVQEKSKRISGELDRTLRSIAAFNKL
ncbi:MAG: hypothetical protein GW809_03615 [Bacteroidetes bacterium]|nr:hypothetical protein [Bacteroidota bacterium]NCQ11235.1 hypothetical protein [Bacteroidota bacterium]